MIKEVLLLCFIIYSRFFVPPRLSYEQLLKNTCQPYKIWYKKAYVTATGLKDHTKNFSPFLYKRPFDSRKGFLKSSQFHFKGCLPLQIHFKWLF